MRPCGVCDPDPVMLVTTLAHEALREQLVEHVAILLLGGHQRFPGPSLIPLASMLHLICAPGKRFARGAGARTAAASLARPTAATDAGARPSARAARRAR